MDKDQAKRWSEITFGPLTCGGLREQLKQVNKLARWNRFGICSRRTAFEGDVGSGVPQRRCSVSPPLSIR